MIKCFLSTYRIRFSMAVNRWIYYLQKIPIVKMFIPDSLYHTLGMKNGLSVIMVIFALLSEIFKKGFYILVLVLPVVSLVENHGLRLSAFIQLFIFFSVLGGSISNVLLFHTDDSRRLILKIMRFNRSQYIRMNVFSENIIYAVFMFLGLSGAMALLGGNALQAAALVILGIGSHMLNDLLQMNIFMKRQTLPMIKYNGRVIALSCAVIGAGIALLFANAIYPFENIIYYSFVMIIPIIYVSYKIQTFPAYGEASQLSIQIYENLLSSVGNANNASFQDVAIRDKDIVDIKKDKKLYRNLKGYRYLNAVFFHRQKRVFLRPIKNRILFIGAVTAAFIVFGLSGDDMIKKSTTLTQLLPGLVFVMYGMNVGSRAIRSLFYNCDVSLLEYSFYRRKEAVIKNFVTRLRYLILYNFIPAVFLCICLVVAITIVKFPYTVSEMIIILFTILLLSVLFSVHYLFVYYVFQPFSRDLNMKNPFFNLINSVMYILCFSALQLNNVNGSFVFYVLGFTILYIVISLFSVYKYAPKTFRIR